MELSDWIIDNLEFVGKTQSFGLWLAIAFLIVIKRRLVLPRLENHYKKNYVTQERRKRRQLLDTLNDPILTTELETKLAKKKKFSNEQVAERIAELREYAETEVADDEQPKVRREKQDAATGLLTLTFMSCVALFFFAPYLCDLSECAFYGLNFQCLTISFVQVLDSYLIQQLEIRKNLTSSSRGGGNKEEEDISSSPNEEGDLETPLLG